MTPDKAIYLLERLKDRCTVEEIEAIEISIKWLMGLPSSIGYAQMRINRLTQRIKDYESVQSAEARHRVYNDKITLGRWIEVLAQRQQILIKETENV